MIEKKYFCDHCGKDITDIDSYIGIDIDSASKCIEADLCNDCAEKLNKLIGDFINKDVTT